MNVNVCTSAFYQRGDLTELIQQFNKLGQHSRESLTEFLKGLQVTKNHIKDDKGKPRLRFHTIQSMKKW